MAGSERCVRSVPWRWSFERVRKRTRSHRRDAESATGKKPVRRRWVFGVVLPGRIANTDGAVIVMQRRCVGTPGCHVLRLSASILTREVFDIARSCLGKTVVPRAPRPSHRRCRSLVNCRFIACGEWERAWPTVVRPPSFPLTCTGGGGVIFLHARPVIRRRGARDSARVADVLPNSREQSAWSSEREMTVQNREQPASIRNSTRKRTICICVARAWPFSS